MSTIKKLLALMLSLTVMFSVNTGASLAIGVNSTNCTKLEEDYNELLQKYNKSLANEAYCRENFLIVSVILIFIVGGLFSPFLWKLYNIAFNSLDVLHGTVNQRLAGINNNYKLQAELNRYKAMTDTLLTRDLSMVKLINKELNRNLIPLEDMI